MSTEKLTVIIATHNEAENIARCIESVKEIASEIIVADAHSSDETVQIAQKLKATILSMPNRQMFHKNKEEARAHATGDWILFLDADESLTMEGAKEIHDVLCGLWKHSPLPKAFVRHMHMIEERDHVLYKKTVPFSAFFLARKNYFLGRFLMHSGVYPDGVIRLVKRDMGYWPCKDVHETMVVSGGVSWLTNPLIHMADPTFSRYLIRANRYTSLTAQSYKDRNLSKNILNFIWYIFLLPVKTFLLLFFRHKGLLDGWSGFVWCLMSALHHPIAYLKYLFLKESK